MMRLYQIRVQVRAVVDSLASTYVAGKLKLTDEQKEKLAEITKDVAGETIRTVRQHARCQRGAAERRRSQKLRKIRSDTDEKALGVLTAEQKEAFEKMKGEKIELPSRRGR